MLNPLFSCSLPRSSPDPGTVTSGYIGRSIKHLLQGGCFRSRVVKNGAQWQLQRLNGYTQPHPQDIIESKQASGKRHRGDGNPGLLTSSRPAGLPRQMCFCFCLWWWLLLLFHLLLKSSFPLCLRNPKASEALPTKIGLLLAGRGLDLKALEGHIASCPSL